MMETIMGDKVRMFASQCEPEALAQVERTARMPFVRGVAVMPDVHFGRGSTVGTVVATKGAVMPACVGVDIGCGMIAVRTNIKPEQLEGKLSAIREGIERRIPLGIGPYGMNSRVLPSAEERVTILESESAVKWASVHHMNARAKDWRLQVGSLGGGNHFIEVCVGRELSFGMLEPQMTNPFRGEYRYAEEVWVILHSGSRGVGNKTGTYWTNVAKKQATRFMYDSYLPDPDLAYLVEHSEEYHEYLNELYWCQRFAQFNRDEMMDRVLVELIHTLNLDLDPLHLAMGIEVERINCHHNYVSKETHDGEVVLITRKGAVLAANGVRSLIPGSMGARSFICTGLGHPGSFHSAPHGAGRRMSRTAARKVFTVDTVRAELEAQGIEVRVREAIIDEAPGAYKDIDVVMHDARELVRPTHVLKQLISVKGD